jgi:hypothetical protein
MKCFYHPNVDAVGVCKSCGRALCRDCITEVGLSCSCKGRCESVVATMNDLVVRGGSAYQKSGALQIRNGILITLLGGLFAVPGFLNGDNSPWTYFMIGAGIIFAIMGLSSIYSGVRFKQK